MSVFGISHSDMTHQIFGPCQGSLKKPDSCSKQQNATLFIDPFCLLDI